MPICSEMALNIWPQSLRKNILMSIKLFNFVLLKLCVAVSWF